MKLDIMIIFMLCINIMLVLGGVFDEAQLYDSSLSTTAKREGNILPSFFRFTNGSLSDPEVSYNSAFLNETTGLQSAGGVTTGQNIGFTDIITMIRSFGSFLWSAVSAPFQLLFNPNLGLPWAFRMMFALPYTILYVFAFVRWFRTGD